MSRIIFQVRHSPGGKHVAQAVIDGEIIAVSSQAYTNGEEARLDVEQVLAKMRIVQAAKIYTPEGVTNVIPIDWSNAQ